MGFFKNIKNFLYKADFFYTTQLLRYKGQPEFRTIFGGVLSVILIFTLIGTFYNKFVDTLNKVVITSVSSNENAANPTPFTISTFNQDQFMVGVEIWHHDLNNGDRYFDMVLTSAEFNTGEPQAKSIEYDLEPCQLSHWQGFPDVQNNFTRLKMDQWLCLPKNKYFNIQGKYASQFSQTLQFSVRKCTNSSKYQRPCASHDQINKYFEESGPLFFTIYFINPLINPTSQQYLTHYLEDNNYIIFTDRFGSQGILFMEEYEVTTDQSILPYSDLRDDKGGIVNEMAVKNPYEVTQKAKVYCSFSFFKSGIKRTYERKFQKIDEILSYIGGLFGTIAVALFIVNAYNSNSFQITLGANLFHNKNQKQQNQLKKYNFLNFLVHLVYMVFDVVGCPPNWKVVKKYNDCRQEMKKQLDILYLLQRVFFLERTMNTLLGEHQVKGLYLHQKLTLEQAKKSRQNFKVKRILMKKSRQSKEKQKKHRDNQTVPQKSIIQKDLRKDPQKDPIKITEQTLQMIDPTVYETKKEDIFMDVNSSSNQKEISNKFQKGQLNNGFPNNKIQATDGQSSEITGQSDSEDNQIQIDFAEDMDRLKRQSEKGNGLSQKIWERIKPSLRERISQITSVQAHSSQHSLCYKKQSQTQNQIKYLDYCSQKQYSLDQHSPAKFMRPSKMKIKNQKQSFTQNVKIKDNRHDQAKQFENVLIQNELKTSPTNQS